MKLIFVFLSIFFSGNFMRLGSNNKNQLSFWTPNLKAMIRYTYTTVTFKWSFHQMLKKILLVFLFPPHCISIFHSKFFVSFVSVFRYFVRTLRLFIWCCFFPFSFRPHTISKYIVWISVTLLCGK